MVRVGWALCLVLTFAVSLLPSVGAQAACASPDRCFSTTQTFDDTAVVVNGNVTVGAGARLTLRNSDLLVNGPGARLVVEPGGHLVLDNARVLGSGPPLLVANGLVEGTSSSLIARDATIGATGRITWTGGAITVSAGIASAPGGILQVTAASVVTGDADGSDVLAGSTRLDNVRWNGTGRQGWSGELVANGLVARRLAFACNGGSVALRGSDLRSDGPDFSLQTQACTGTIEQTRLMGRGAWRSLQDNGITASNLDATGNLTKAIDSFGSTLTVRDARLRGNGPALQMAGAGNVVAERIDAASLGSTALSCTDGALTARGGTWRGTASAVQAQRCAGTLSQLALAGGTAVRWDNHGATTPTGPVELTDLTFTAVSTLGDGVPQAYDLRASGSVAGLQAPAGTPLLRWRALDATATHTLARLDPTGSSCGIELVGATFTVTQVKAGPASQPLCLESATVQVSSSDLSAAAAPMRLASSSASLQDVRIDPATAVLDATSNVLSRRSFAPLALYKNGAPAVGASVELRTLEGGALAQGTADGNGRPPGYPIEVFRRQGATIQRGADVIAKVRLGELQNETRLALDAAAPAVILRDNTAPGALQVLRQETAPAGELSASWDAATDDHLTPRYEVRLRSAPGTQAVLANGTRIAVDTVTLTEALKHRMPLPGQGLYWLNVTPVDRSGNRGAGLGLRAAWDTQPPTVSLSLDGAAGPGGWHRGNVSWTATVADAVSGVASQTVRIDGQATTATQVTAAGEHVLEVIVRDHAGNEAVARRDVRIDRDAPTPLQAVPEAPGVRAPGTTFLAVTAPPSDDLAGIAHVRVWVERDGRRTETDRLLAPMPLRIPVEVPAGEILVVLETVDGAGNSAFAAPIALTVDGAGPQPAAPLAQRLPLGDLRLAFDDASGIASVRATLDGEPVGTYQNGVLDAALESSGLLRIEARDVLGNVAVYESRVGAAGKDAPGAGLWLALASVALALAVRHTSFKR